MKCLWHTSLKSIPHAFHAFCTYYYIYKYFLSSTCRFIPFLKCWSLSSVAKCSIFTFLVQVCAIMAHTAMHRNASQYKSIPLHSKSSWNGRLHRLLGMGGKPTTSGHLLLLDSLVSLTLRTQFSKRTTGKRINAIIKHINMMKHNHKNS